MSLNFVIPTKLEDLCAYDNTRYVIETDYNAKEVATLIEGMMKNDFMLILTPVMLCVKIAMSIFNKMALSSFWKTLLSSTEF